MLTAQAIIKHFTESDETQKGYIQQQKQGMRSTKRHRNNSVTTTGSFPKEKQQDIYAKVKTYTM